MLKTPGAMCPKCYELFPAEHQQIGQPARWTCLACGASGDLAGSLSICKPAPAPAPQGPAVKPHWSEKGLRVHAPMVFRSPEKQVATGGNAK